MVSTQDYTLYTIDADYLKYLYSIDKEVYYNPRYHTQQLYNAIMWLIILWNAKPDTPLFKFKNDVIKYKKYEPFNYRIKSVNTAIKNGGKKGTLTDMINDYKEDNNIRSATCNFELLQNKINDMKDEQGNNIKSYF